MEKQVVVARYREDLRWLWKAHFPVTVYRKDRRASANIIQMQITFNTGDHDPEIIRKPTPIFEEEMPHVTIVDLPNDPRGREAHSYLHHIVHNYYKLADTTFFLQGKPFDHSPHILKLLHLQYDKATTLSSRYLSDRHQDGDIITSIGEYKIKLGEGRRHPSWGKLLTFWDDLFPAIPVPEPFYYGYGAMWAVPKEDITQRSFKFWEYLLGRVSEIDGWVFELLWYYLFADAKIYKDRMTRKNKNPMI